MVVVSGFLPVPLPMMIPFMGAQSLVIGKMFGEGFQYGKRKISAMPNEEFNKLTFESMMSNARDEMKASIPTMQKALGDMQPLVQTVIHEFFDYIKIISAMLPEQTRQLTGGADILDTSSKTLKLTQEQRDWLEAQGNTKDIDLGALSAFADTGAADSSSLPSTVVGLTVSEAQLQARMKQTLFERRQILAKEAHARLVVGGNITTPTPQIQPGLRQRAAGQSQRIERKYLIGRIAHWAALVKANPSGTGFVANLRGQQQKLVNLLARYRF